MFLKVYEKAPRNVSVAHVVGTRECSMARTVLLVCLRVAWVSEVLMEKIRPLELTSHKGVEAL